MSRVHTHQLLSCPNASPLRSNSDHARVKEGFETSLKALGVDYIDLFLIHWPQASTPDPKDPTNAFAGKNVPYGEFPTPVDTWKEMEKLDKKLCRAIGWAGRWHDGEKAPC